MSDCGPRPKKPMSAFLMWMNSNGRKHIKAKHPEISIQDVSVKGGEMWRAMIDEDKVVWLEAARTAMDEYKEKVEQWNTLREQSEICLSPTYSQNYESQLSSRFSKTNQQSTLFVYDCKDETMAPICRKCFSKIKCFH